MPRQTLVLIALGLLAACSPLPAANSLLVHTDHRVVDGAAYGPHGRHRLDVYAPEAASGAPVVVFFYGGAWTSGERAHYRFVGEALAARGIVAVIPDYRLHPEVGFPDFVEDGAEAVRWTLDNVETHGGDPGRVAVAGHSAGAHLAALLALDERYLGPDAARLAGLVGLAGPYAFDPLAYDSTRPVFEGHPEPDDLRPLALAGAHAPPALLLHGEADGTVLIVNTLELAARLREAGVPVRAVTYRRIGHVPLLLALFPGLRWTAPVLDDVAAFVHGLVPQAQQDSFATSRSNP
jgi:acetyl esterase/lipase